MAVEELKPTGDLSAGYARILRRRMIYIGLLSAAVTLSIICDIATGPSVFPLADILSGVFAPESLSQAQRVILWDVRMPYAVLAVVVGASLGLAGAEMQTVLNNPLASPYTLGVTSAATLGAALAIVLDLRLLLLSDTYIVPLSAICFALAASFLIQLLARIYGASVDTMILFGIALVFLCNALVSLLQFIAVETALEQIVFWTIGSLARASWPKVAAVTVVLLICFPLAMRNAWALTSLRTGEDYAQGMGIPVERLRLKTLLRVSILAAVAVAFVGSIGFIGLVGPHIARLAIGEDHRFYLPASALSGALVLSLASTASKVLVPGLIVPVGIVTAMVGIPLFMSLVLTQRRGA